MQAGGVITALTPVVIAPAIVNILPSRVTRAPRPTAPTFENKVPFIFASAAIVIAAPDIKKTLQDFVPLIKVTVELDATENAPKNLITKKALESPPPSRIRFPVKDPAAPV